jgi:hypothetical protein
MASLGICIGIAFGGDSATPAVCPEEKYGSDLVQSLVYWAAVFVVVPRAESKGDVTGCGEEGETYL